MPADPTWIILSPANQLCLVGRLPDIPWPIDFFWLLGSRQAWYVDHSVWIWIYTLGMLIIQTVEIILILVTYAYMWVVCKIYSDFLFSMCWIQTTSFPLHFADVILIFFKKMHTQMFTNTHAYCWDLELGPPSRGSYWERKKLSERHARVTTLSTLGVNPPTTEPPRRT